LPSSKKISHPFAILGFTTAGGLRLHIDHAHPAGGKHFRQEQVLKTHMKVHDKPPRPPGKPKEPAGPKAETSTTVKRQQPKNFEQYQDPAAERAAATAELLAYQIEENEAKRKAEAELRKIQEAAYEQLNKLQKQTNTYDGFYAQKAEAEGTSVDALKLDHV